MKTDNELCIDRSLLRDFFQQLYDNIGFSRYYNRFIVIEPLCFLKVKRTKVYRIVPIDGLAFEPCIGKVLASYIDSIAPDEQIEQSFLPYIHYSSSKYILLSEDRHLKPISRECLALFLSHLKKHPNMISRTMGFAHYHINETELSQEDRSVHIRLSKEFELMGSESLMGLVISEDDPSDSLPLIHLGKAVFVNHMSMKLKNQSIRITGEVFTQQNKHGVPLNIKILDGNSQALT